MKEILFFYIPTCSHSAAASDEIDKIQKEFPQYANVRVIKIDENLNADFAAKFDYNYVPCMYVDGIKYIEGDCTREQLLDMFQKICG